jgi:putative redox protein
MEQNFDKSKEMKATISLINNKVHFEGFAGENKPVSIDYFPPIGDNLGYTSLELLLLSLSSCVGTAILTFLRKMGKTIFNFDIFSRGIRKEQHPTGFSIIYLEIIVISDDVNDSDLDKVIKLAEETYCPVWSMIKGNVELKIDYQINKK